MYMYFPIGIHGYCINKLLRSQCWEEGLEGKILKILYFLPKAVDSKTMGFLIILFYDPTVLMAFYYFHVSIKNQVAGCI